MLGVESPVLEIKKIASTFSYGKGFVKLISSTGLSTPSIEAKVMNQLPFSAKTKRIPIWGLGCAGGAAGLSRAYEYVFVCPGQAGCSARAS